MNALLAEIPIDKQRVSPSVAEPRDRTTRGRTLSDSKLRAISNVPRT
jgi:hypothetical protein